MQIKSNNNNDGQNRMMIIKKISLVLSTLGVIACLTVPTEAIAENYTQSSTNQVEELAKGSRKRRFSKRRRNFRRRNSRRRPSNRRKKPSRRNTPRSTRTPHLNEGFDIWKETREGKLKTPRDIWKRTRNSCNSCHTNKK